MDRENRAGVDAPEIEITSAIESLAKHLFEELERLVPSDDASEWANLDEGEKELYRTCVEGLLVKWQLVNNAHRELTAHAFGKLPWYRPITTE